MNRDNRRPLAIERAPHKDVDITPFYRMRWDSARYLWSGTAAHYIGRIIQDVPEDVQSIYPVRRQDAHGPYMALYCLIDPAKEPYACSLHPNDRTPRPVSTKHRTMKELPQ